MRCTGPSKGYLTTEDKLSPEAYYKPDLLGGSISYDVNLSNMQCGCVASFIQVEMPARNSSGFVAGDDKDYYCDANGVGGSFCPEFDIMLANRRVFQTAGHTCDAPNAGGDYHFCDRPGKPVQDFDSRSDNYGPVSDWQIDTNQPFNVMIEYSRGGDDNLENFKVTLTQGTKKAYRDGYRDTTALSRSLDGNMAFVFMLWGEGDMNMWLDGRACGF